MATSSTVLSPTLSSTTSSSFVRVTSHSDDEVVYSVDDFSSDDSSHLASDDDFVVLSRPWSPRPASQSGFYDSDGDGGRAHTPNLASLASDLQSLSLKDSGSLSWPKTKRVVVGDPGGKLRPSLPSTASGIAPSAAATLKKSKSPKKKKKGKKSKAAASSAKKANSSAVEDSVSDQPSTYERFSSANAPKETLYEEAVDYITSFITNPEAKEHTACRLTLLQALIIELGLATSSLPASLTAARNLLKSRVFLNIREYLAVRGQGLKALRGIMHPSRKSLIKAIKKKKNAAPLAWVKESGLQVLLVHAYH